MVEILKHLAGDWVIEPRLSTAGEQRAEISGREKSDNLLSAQEAVHLQVVAGAAPQTTPRTLELLMASPSGLFGSPWEQLPGGFLGEVWVSTPPLDYSLTHCGPRPRAGGRGRRRR